MGKYNTLSALLSAIADAIRSKTGDGTAIAAEDFPAAISGISGGGGVTGLAYDMGDFVLDADSTGFGKIYHNLGELPGFVLVWTDDYAGVTNPDTSFPTSLGFLWMNQIMGLDNWFTATASGKGTTVLFTQSKGSTGMNVVKPTSRAYTMSADGSATNAQVTPEYFQIVKIGNTTYYRAGTVYKYFVSKAWWNIGGVASAE